MKKILSIILVATLVMKLTMTGYATESGFKDTGSHWARTTIENWQNLGLINGYSDGGFQPDASINRAEFIALVNRIYGYYETDEVNYIDVDSDDWFYNDVAIARAYGYTSFYGELNINPLEAITRQEVCIILAHVMDLDLSKNGASLEAYIDSDQVPDWSYVYMAAMVNSGYMNGYTDYSLRPGQDITRAEAVVMLDRVMGELINISGTYGGDSEESLESITGNLTVNSRDVVLENMVIDGDLILGAGIGDGDVALNNITVKGRTIINGGGEASITITGSNLAEVRVYKLDGKIRVVLTGSEAESLILQSGGELEGDYSGTNIYVDTGEGQEVIFDGDFESVEVDSDVNILVPAGSYIANITFNAKATVTGRGDIGTVILNSSDVEIDYEVDDVNIGVDTNGVEEEEVLSSSNSIKATEIGQLYNGNIVEVPTTTTVGALKAGLSVSPNASVDVIDGPGGSVVQNQATTIVTEDMRIQVRAEDGSKAEYTLSYPDTKAPVVTSYSPTADAIDIAPDSVFVITFNEDIQLGSGNITIKKASDNQALYTIDVTDTTQISCSGNQVIIDPSLNLASETAYYINIDSGAIEDTAIAENDYSGIADTSTWAFTTTVDENAPEITSLSPVDTSILVDNDLEITFDEAIQGISGKAITIYQGDGTIEETIAADGANVTIVDSVVTINPTNDLTGETDFYVMIEAGAFTDTATIPNEFAGINDTTTWCFTTLEGGIPTYTVGTGADGGDNEQELKFTVGIDELGTGYYAISESPLSPTETELKAGSLSSTITKGSINLYPGVEVSKVMDDLMPGEIYYVYLLAEDLVGNFAEIKEYSVVARLVQGDGSEADPFKIWAIEDLAKIGSGESYMGTGTWEMSSYYILMDDLDFDNSSSYRSYTTSYTTGRGFTRIGSYMNHFTGGFDGNSKTINGLYMYDSGASYQGFFGNTTGAYIHDLTLTDIDVQGDQYVGGIVGQLNGGSLASCTVSGYVKTSYLPAGELVGNNNGGSILSCTSAVYIIVEVIEEE